MCGNTLESGVCATKFGTGWGHAYCVTPDRAAPPLRDPLGAGDAAMCLRCRSRPSQRSNGLCEECVVFPQSCPPPAVKATAVPSQRWGSPGVVAVWDSSYSPTGVYLSTSTLRSKATEGRRVPPAREDSEAAQTFGETDDALEASLRRKPLKQKVEVWR